MSDASSRKPTPVRATLAGDTSGRGARFASRDFKTDEEESWRVEELGWSRSGRREDPGTPLLLLGFRREGEEEFDREALVPARRLSDLPESALVEILQSARAFQGPSPKRPFFADTRSRGREARGRRRGRPRR